MFTEFFFFLRAKGLRVSTTEWLDLLAALKTGLAGTSLMGFYSLCRCLVVKHESHFDLFDQCFAAYFQGTTVPEDLKDQLNKDLLEWLKQAAPAIQLTAEQLTQIQNLDPEEIKRMFEQRLKEQKERHDGGNHWVGTGGTSAFGNSGYHPGGIRVGGESRNRSAMQIATERRFQNLRSDIVLDTRQMGLALKKLRILSHIGTHSEIDIDGTINKAGKNGGDIDLVFKKSRKNTVKLLLLTDVGGSMTPYSQLCSRLFSAAEGINHFKAFRHYYFHNCVYDVLFTDIQRMETVSTNEVLADMDETWHLLIIGDAAMNPYELLAPGGCIDYFIRNKEPGILWLDKIKKKIPASIWLNPEPPQWWDIQSCQIVRRVFSDMYPLTIEGLTDAIDRLKAIKI